MTIVFLLLLRRRRRRRRRRRFTFEASKMVDEDFNDLEHLQALRRSLVEKEARKAYSMTEGFHYRFKKNY